MSGSEVGDGGGCEMIDAGVLAYTLCTTIFIKYCKSGTHDVKCRGLPGGYRVEWSKKKKKKNAVDVNRAVAEF